MNYKTIAMQPRKRIALVAHDHKKRDLIEWARYDRVLPDYDEYRERLKRSA